VTVFAEQIVVATVDWCRSRALVKHFDELFITAPEKPQFTSAPVLYSDYRLGKKMCRYSTAGKVTAGLAKTNCSLLTYTRWSWTAL